MAVEPEYVFRYDSTTERVVLEPVAFEDLGGFHYYVDDNGLTVKVRLAPGEVFSGERRPRCVAVLTHNHGRSLCHYATGHPMPHEAGCAACEDDGDFYPALQWTADGEDWTTRKKAP